MDSRSDAQRLAEFIDLLATHLYGGPVDILDEHGVAWRHHGSDGELRMLRAPAGQVPDLNLLHQMVTAYLRRYGTTTGHVTAVENTLEYWIHPQGAHP